MELMDHFSFPILDRTQKLKKKEKKELKESSNSKKVYGLYYPISP